ncbi:MAG: hemerythrin domain-containing protein [Acidobacteriota bacterium]
MDTSRRTFITQAGMVVGSGLWAEALMPSAVMARMRAAEEEEVSATEDLMREHGLLNRVLLIYDDVVHRMNAKKEFPPDALKNAASIIKEFIEEYHEKLEEDHLFSRFEKAKQMTELVDTLHTQHDAGRDLTGFIIKHANASDLKDAKTAKDVAGSIASFNRMYRPHESREDTILFPAFKKLVSKHEYDALGEEFEKEEKKKFGSDGFESVLHRVETIERTLGLYDLSQFTPKL